MKYRSPNIFHAARTRFGFAAIGLALTALVAGLAAADDRDLLRERASDPYVFIVFDTSGSMHWSPVCSAEDACEDIDPYDRACTSECAFGDVTCSQLCPDFGCVEFGPNDLAPRREVEIDDTDVTAVSITGFWPTAGSLTGPAFGGSAIYDNDSRKGSKRVTFSVDVPETRRYKVFISVPQSDQWATNVPVRVSGTVNDETVTIDQRYVAPVLADGEVAPPYKPWKLVGVYPLVAGTTVQIQVRNDDTNGPVVADGVRLVSEVKECLRQGYRCTVPLCPSGDCNVPLNQDDPGSKFFQAKQALYEVLEDIPFVRFGFATFEQDDLRVNDEHWLYRVRERQIDLDPDDGIDPPLQSFIELPNGNFFPRPGDDDVFGVFSINGSEWDCNHDNLADDAGCFRTEPAYLFDGFEWGRFHRLSKLGRSGSAQTQYWITENANDSNPLRVTYNLVSGTYGDQNITVSTTVERCTNGNCTNFALVDSKSIAYDLRSDFIGREGDSPPTGFRIGNSEDANASGSASCGNTFSPAGWDPNDDTNQDDFGSINLRWPTSSDPRSTSGNKRVFDEGDVIPWDWLPGADHTSEIQRRLAPNTVTDPTAIPDFRVAKYLATPSGSGNLSLADTDTTNGVERPMIAWGSTPLGGALNSIDNWFDEFRKEAEEGGTAGDPVVDVDWSCRERFVLMLTDGDETCSGSNGIDPCNAALTLHNKQVDTFVVGFGLQNAPGNRLNCMASNGGTQAPFFPRNKDELVATLTDIFGEVQTRARSFASAALPAVQATAADKVIFSSFTPLPGRAVWPGRVDVIRQPVVDTIERMVCTRNCDRANLESGCQVFNAGDTILAQAPTDVEIDAVLPDANFGKGRFERRVFYPLAYRPASEDGTLPQPLPMRLFELPDLDLPSAPDQAIIEDLVEVMVRPSELVPGQTILAQLPALKDPIKETYRNLFRLKNSPDLADSPFTCPETPSGAPSNWTPGDYLLGDVFHTTTTVISGPRDLELRRQDRCGPGPQATPNNCAPFTAAQEAEAQARGYRNFARRGGFFRNILTVGANDGQLHFFDAGVRAEVDDLEVFTDGTGAELFAFIPRLVMPIVREQARPGNDRQIFSIDGGFVIDDVFIDPVFTVAPEGNDREWRRVLVGGLREAGDRFDDNRDIEGFVSGYYALDITQPDGLEEINNDVADPTGTSVVDNQYVPDELVANGILPSCLEIENDGDLVPKGTPACRSVAGAQLPFPAFKWEFADRVFFLGSASAADDDDEHWYLLDEDENGEHDLADTWSKPLIGQVRVTEGGSETVKWVAIFGGGIDPARNDPATRGNWLYMVDIETGTAIYKRQLVGAAPADVTGTVDETGILSALYIGTTAGFMYKIDLRESVPLVTVRIEDDQILGWPNSSDINVRRITDPRWDPFAIFTTDGKPIFQTPALIQVPVLDTVALAWGSGNREDLWTFDGTSGRFYIIVDDEFERPTAGSPLPHSEPDFVTFDFNAPLVGFDAAGDPLVEPPDFLTDDGLRTNDDQPARRGWVMRLPLEARVTSRAFAISGVLVFTVFQPRFDPVTGTDEPCRRSGLSRTFVVDVRNGDALTTLENTRNAALTDDRGLRGGDGQGAAASGINVAGGPAKTGQCGDRCIENEGLTTAPSVEGNATPNPAGATGTISDPLDNPISKRLLENIKRNFFPPGCQFNDTFVHRIRMQLDNTELRDIAPVPIGVCPSDWAEGAPVWSEDR